MPKTFEEFPRRVFPAIRTNRRGFTSAGLLFDSSALSRAYDIPIVCSVDSANIIREFFCFPETPRSAEERGGKGPPANPKADNLSEGVRLGKSADDLFRYLLEFHFSLENRPLSRGG
ncbi:hypothetical protein CEXT_772561 [Caerostris extrusa]|uniref:Uncharacterized protein n=1 Tax=Caerostris extrusa TaxID=172846 RepID=A0AAV4NPY5_CAEEX|nr:hypothetical protein CEXT_772561 [Caerostris extrusa]